MGAPPLAIPAPEALNMTAIAVTSEGAGSATVNVSPGAGRPDSNLVVKNLGDVAWHRPFKEWLLPKAYAVGETVIKPIGPNGATLPPTFTISAAPKDWLEFKQCLKANPTVCSPSFRIEVVNGVSPPPVPMSNIKSMSVGKDGVYTNESSSSKKWRWMDLFISKAHAADAPPPVQATGFVMYQTATLYIDPATTFTPPVCREAPYQGLNYAAESDMGKFCIISFTPLSQQSSTTPERTELIRIPNCDASEGLVYAADKGGVPYLYVTSRNKIFEVNKNEKKIVSQVAYPNGTRISQVQFLDDYLFVTLDPGSVNAPRLWVNHDCKVAVSYLADALKITGSASYLRNFAFTIHHPTEYCAWWGETTFEFVLGNLTKIPNTCQANPLDGVEITRGGYKTVEGRSVNCGLNFVTLSPNDKKILNIWQRGIVGVSSSCAADSVTTVTIPYSTTPLDMAFNGRDTLAVLDEGPGGVRKLISFKVQANGDFPEKMDLLYMSSTELPSSTATLVDYSPSSDSFVTNDFSPENVGSLRTIRSVTVQRAIPSMPVLNVEGVLDTPPGSIEGTTIQLNLDD